MSFDPALTVFMLVKTSPEWLAFTDDRRAELVRRDLVPILEKYDGDIRLRYFDLEFYSARVTDLWMWEARSHRAYRNLVEEIRATPFWDRYFSVVEILPALESAVLRDLSSLAANSPASPSAIHTAPAILASGSAL
jgi:hypothetical protein